MRLPNFGNAIIATEKLRQYCFSVDHEVGKHKAYLFSKLWGFSQSNSKEFESLLRTIIEHEEVAFSKPNEYAILHRLNGIAATKIFPDSDNLDNSIN